MIKIGDKVKFLNDVGGGIVTGFIGKNRVNVENQDGFEIPYPVSQLINVSDPDLNKRERVRAPQIEDEIEEQPDTIEDEETGQIIAGKDSPDFYFCFVPADNKNPLAGEIALYLVNDSNFNVLFHYSHLNEDVYTTMDTGTVPPNSKKLLEGIAETDINELPQYIFNIIFFKDEDSELRQPVTKKFRVNPVKFYKEKSFHSNQYFDRNAMIFQITQNLLDTEINKLTDDDFQKVVKQKEQKPAEKKPQRRRDDEIIEVDLHIHELLDNPAGLSNKEMLDVQLEKVESEMRSAIQSQTKRIVFIHGVGQGVLKQEVAKLLKSKFQKYRFQDASFKEYGYGATMVMLRRK
jgi:DNA-nicking Smr family endonuclease